VHQLLLLLQWFNRMLEEMWPYYDRGICSTIKSTLEPIIESYRWAAGPGCCDTALTVLHCCLLGGLA
jgi:hypothetical protein